MDVPYVPCPYPKTTNPSSSLRCFAFSYQAKVPLEFLIVLDGVV
jgi:hypothetical protein